MLFVKKGMIIYATIIGIVILLTIPIHAIAGELEEDKKLYVILSAMNDIDSVDSEEIRIDYSQNPPIVYKKSLMTVEATAYAKTGNPTATGVYPTIEETVAVDPSVIPLGSKIYNPLFGWRTAQDTGDAVKGKIIDVYWENKKFCKNWGRKILEIEVWKKI